MFIVVTTEAVPGYEVISTPGYVEVCRPVLLAPFASGVKSLNTGRTIPYPDLVNLVSNARETTLDALMRKARYMGANAIVGLRWSERPVTTTWMELHVYGTAVVVEELRTRDQPLEAVLGRVTARHPRRERP